MRLKFVQYILSEQYSEFLWESSYKVLFIFSLKNTFICRKNHFTMCVNDKQWLFFEIYFDMHENK